MTLACTVAPHDPALQRGQEALSLGRAEDAEDAYRTALARRPEDPRALHGLARSFVARGAGEAALESFARLERVDPGYLRGEAATDHRFALYQAAKARLRRGDSEGALRRLRRLESLEPDHAGLDALMTRALVAEGARLQLAGRAADSEALLREALGGELAGRDLSFDLAEMLLADGYLDAAISLLSDGLMRHPGDPRLRALMDRALEIRYPDSLFDGKGRRRKVPR